MALLVRGPNALRELSDFPNTYLFATVQGFVVAVEATVVSSKGVRIHVQSWLASRREATSTHESCYKGVD